MSEAHSGRRHVRRAAQPSQNGRLAITGLHFLGSRRAEKRVVVNASNPAGSSSSEESVEVCLFDVVLLATTALLDAISTLTKQCNRRTIQF